MPESSVWCMELAEADARDGQRAKAEREMGTCSTKSQAQPGLLIYLGQPSRAIAMLQMECDARDPYMAYLNVDPTYDSLRGEPDFQKLLRRLGF